MTPRPEEIYKLFTFPIYLNFDAVIHSCKTFESIVKNQNQNVSKL